MSNESVAEMQAKSGSRRRNELLNRYLYDSRQKSYFVAALTVVFAALLIVVAVIPSFSSVLSQNQANGEIDIVIADAEAKLETLRILTAEKDENQAVVDQLNSSLPDGQLQEDVLSEIYGFVVDNGGYFVSFSFPDSTSLDRAFLQSLDEVSQKVDVQQINLNFDSTREDALRVASSIENSKKIYRIASMSLTKRSDEDISIFGEDRAFTVNMTIETYYWKEDVELDFDSESVVETEQPSNENNVIDGGVDSLEPGVGIDN